MSEKIEQRHREKAAKMIPGFGPKQDKVRALILAGKADDHPSVQAAAFYETKNET